MPTGPAPLNADFAEQGGPRGGTRMSREWRAWLDRLNRTMINVGSSGTSTARPTNNLYPGLCFFDTTLGKPVFVKTVGPPIVWVDATGAIV